MSLPYTETNRNTSSNSVSRLVLVLLPECIKRLSIYDSLHCGSIGCGSAVGIGSVGHDDSAVVRGSAVVSGVEVPAALSMGVEADCGRIGHVD